MPLDPATFADGFPDWAVAGEERRAHVARVVTLLDDWAVELGMSGADRRRLRAAGWLHDALRDASGDVLRPMVAPELRDLPRKLLHGPAAAARLRELGMSDDEVLDAVAYHTVGHPGLTILGRLVYLADFLEPGRRFDPVGRASLRARMPHDWRSVLMSVVRSRVRHLLDSGNPIRPETMGYWNTVVADVDA
ncbi:MAG TPA: HD domain-containing protein [Longimicrobiales bacterium]